MLTGWMDSAAAGSGRRGGGGGGAEAGGGGRIRSARRRRGSRGGRRGRPEPRGRRGRPDPVGTKAEGEPRRPEGEARTQRPEGEAGSGRRLPRPYRDFQKEWRLQLNDFTDAVYEGRLYGPDDFAQLESMPTRAQSYQYLLGCLQMPAVNVLAALRARQEAMAQGDKPAIEEAAVPAPAAEK